MSESIFLGFFIVIGLSMFIEHILLLSWNYGYFTTGIVAYQKHTFLSHTSNLTPAINHVQLAITPTFLHGSVEFNEIRPNVFLFRNKHYELRLYGLGRGTGTRRVMYYDPATGEIEIKGFLNWTYLLVWGVIVIVLAFILSSNFSFWGFIVAILIAIIIFVVSLYSAAIDSKVNDEVIYHLKVYFRKKITSVR